MDDTLAKQFPTSALAASTAPFEDRVKEGERLRKTVTRSSHGSWSEPDDRPDPTSLLEAQNESRLQDLVPIRWGRMLDSPFTYFRGAAAVMAADLAGTPTTAVEVQACGDAHLANFGVYASPERHLVFDLNDFDESAPGPWEWDLKRLSASAVLVARERAFSSKVALDCALEVGRMYRETIGAFSSTSTLDVWYSHVDVDEMLREQAGVAMTKDDEKRLARTRKVADKAHHRDTLQALSKLTEIRDGQRRIVSDPPLLIPMATGLDDDLGVAYDDYAATLPIDRRLLLERFHVVEIARKVVGVGSVGTRSWILLLLGQDNDDPLFLQVKQAQASVLEPYWRPSPYKNHAERVVVGQRLMQAESDIFLGWTNVSSTGVDFYVRQLRDMKGGVDLSRVKAGDLARYVGVCGAVLARAHARTGDAAVISGYLGDNDRFDTALAEFAVAYADQSERDHARLEKAAKHGRITVERGI